MYRTRHRNMLLHFNVILDASQISDRRNEIYDAFVRIIKNPLNSTIFCRVNTPRRRVKFKMKI